MVCFDITLAYPTLQSYKATLTQEQRLEHLRKHYNADTLGTSRENGIVYVRFAVCDEDAVGLLRDIPHPVYCIQIKILRRNSLLYSFWKVTNIEVIPPRNHKVLKDVYWSASQLERRLV
jgi:hypothetical protein